MSTLSRRLLAASLILSLSLPNPALALRAGLEGSVERELSAGLEEKPISWKQSKPTEIPPFLAQRLTTALLRLGSTLKTQPYYNAKTGTIRLGFKPASQLMGGQPSAATLKAGSPLVPHLKKEINEFLALALYDPRNPDLPGRLRENGRKLWDAGVRSIEIGQVREHDASSWDKRRLVRALRRAQELGLSLRTDRLQHPPQSTQTPAGRELSRAFRRVTQSDLFPQYGRSWKKFLASHGVSLEEVFGPNHERRPTHGFAVYVNLRRDKRGVPILNPKKKVGDFKMVTRALWKIPRIRKATTVYLVDFRRTEKNRQGDILLVYRNHPLVTNLPADSHNPRAPVPLILEIAGDDPFHSVQKARRMDTNKIVYPFDGQIRVYIDPPTRNGRLGRNARLYRAVTRTTPKLWKAAAQAKPKSVFLTHVPSRRREDSSNVFFQMGTNRRYATAYALSKDQKPPLLTVQIATASLDSGTAAPLVAWRTNSKTPIFPQGEEETYWYDLHVDPPLDERGLLKNPSRPADTRTHNQHWEKAWEKTVPAKAKTVVLRGVSAYPVSSSQQDRRQFQFAHEVYSTGPIKKAGSSRELPLELHFSAQDPHRRPQRVFRIDTGEQVYPAPDQQRIYLDPTTTAFAGADPLLFKAVYERGPTFLSTILGNAERTVRIDNVPTTIYHGIPHFWDPLAKKRRKSGGASRVRLVLQKSAGRSGKWQASAAYDQQTKAKIYPNDAKFVQAQRETLLNPGTAMLQRVEAAQELRRLGTLDGSQFSVAELRQAVNGYGLTETRRNRLLTRLLGITASDYHGDVFGVVGTHDAARLFNAAGRRYRDQPAKFWDAVFPPLEEASNRPGPKAVSHIRDAADQLEKASSPKLSAGLEEPAKTGHWISRLTAVSELLQQNGWIQSADAFAGPFQEAWRRLPYSNLAGNGEKPADARERFLRRRVLLRDFIRWLEIAAEGSTAPDRVKLLRKDRFKNLDGYVEKALLEIPSARRLAPFWVHEEIVRNRLGSKLSLAFIQRIGTTSQPVLLGEIRIGKDRSLQDRAPSLHLDIDDPSRQAWVEHVDMAGAWGPIDEPVPNQFNRFLGFMESGLSRIPPASKSALAEPADFAREEFFQQYPNQHRQIPPRADQIRLLPVSYTLVHLYSAGGITEELDQLLNQPRTGPLSLLEFRTQWIPARLTDIRQPAVIVNPNLVAASNRVVVPRMPKTLSELALLALFGKEEAPRRQLLASWILETNEGPRLALATAPARPAAGVEESATDWTRHWDAGFPVADGTDDLVLREEPWQPFFKNIGRTIGNARLLDLASGNLALSLIAKRMQFGFELHAIDRADIKLHQIPDSGEIQFRRADFLQNGYPDGHFNAITGRYGLEYMNPDLRFPELSRILSPGGQGLFLLHHTGSSFVRNARLLTVDGGMLPAALDAYERSAVYLRDGTRENLQRRAEAIGRLLEYRGDSNPRVSGEARAAYDNILAILALPLDDSQAALEILHNHIQETQFTVSTHRDLVKAALSPEAVDGWKDQLTEVGLVVDRFEPFPSDGPPNAWRLELHKPPQAGLEEVRDLTEEILGRHPFQVGAFSGNESNRFRLFVYDHSNGGQVAITGLQAIPLGAQLRMIHDGVSGALLLKTLSTSGILRSQELVSFAGFLSDGPFERSMEGLVGEHYSGSWLQGMEIIDRLKTRSTTYLLESAQAPGKNAQEKQLKTLVLLALVYKLRGYLKEARAIDPIGSIQRVMEYFHNGGDYRPLIDNINRVLENPRRNPRRSSQSGIQNISEIESLNLWFVKEGNATFVYRAEVTLKNRPGKIFFVVNAAKDATLASEVATAAWPRMRPYYETDPLSVMEPYFSGEAGGIAILTGEWVEGDEIHLYVQADGRPQMRIWTHQSSPGEPLSGADMEQVWETMVRMQARYSSLSWGDEGSVAMVRPARIALNAGDLIWHRKPDGSRGPFLIWPWSVLDDTDREAFEWLARSLLAWGVDQESQAPSHLGFWGQPEKALQIAQEEMLEKLRAAAQAAEVPPKQQALFAQAHWRQMVRSAAAVLLRDQEHPEEFLQEQFFSLEERQQIKAQIEAAQIALQTYLTDRLDHEDSGLEEQAGEAGESEPAAVDVSPLIPVLLEAIAATLKAKQNRKGSHPGGLRLTIEDGVVSISAQTLNKILPKAIKVPAEKRQKLRDAFATLEVRLEITELFRDVLSSEKPLDRKEGVSRENTYAQFLRSQGIWRVQVVPMQDVVEFFAESAHNMRSAMLAVREIQRRIETGPPVTMDEVWMVLILFHDLVLRDAADQTFARFLDSLGRRFPEEDRNGDFHNAALVWKRAYPILLESMDLQTANKLERIFSNAADKIEQEIPKDRGRVTDFSPSHTAPRSSQESAGLEERLARSVAMLRQVLPAVPGSVGQEALVFTDPDLKETFDLAALAVRYGWVVAVPDDSPQADALKKLLDALPEPKGRYAVGILESSRFLEGYDRQILIDDREEAFWRLGLRWDDLPAPVAAALESVLAFLDTATEA